MNQLNIMARQRREPQPTEATPPPRAERPTPKSHRSLQDLTLAELREEALYDADLPTAEIDEEQLREEVRWRRAVMLREPGYSALAKLLAAVHEDDSFEELTQGQFTPAQLVEKSEEHILRLRARKLSRLPSLEDHERRLAKLEATLFSDRPLPE